MTNRPGRSRSSRVSPADARVAHAALTTKRETWPKRSAAVDVALNEYLDSAFANATAEDVLALLLRAPRAAQDYLRRILGLPRSARRLNRGMASILLGKMQNQGAMDVAGNLVDGFIQAFESPVLDHAQWAQLLAGTDIEARTIARACSGLPASMEEMARYPSSGQVLGLAIAAQTSPYWLPALALLAVEDQGIDAAYRSFLTDHEDLPVVVRSLAGLIQGITTEPAEGDPPAPEEADTEWLRSAARELDWDDAAAVASRVTDLLEAGEAPQIFELEVLDRFVKQVHELAGRLTLVTQTLVDATSAGISSALDAIDVQGIALKQVRALTTALAPERLEQQMAQVRALAESALGGNEPPEIVSALTALAELADAGRQPAESTDYDTIDSLLELARAGLPHETHRLTDAALRGQLRLGSLEEPPAGPELDGNDAVFEASSDPAAGGEPADSPEEVPVEPQVDEPSLDLADLDRYLQDSGLTAQQPTESREQPSSNRPSSTDVSAVPLVADTEKPDTHAAARFAETQLLDHGRFGTASMLHRDPAHAAARRLAAYQTQLTSSTGDLASAFAEDQPLVTRDALGSDQSGQLLAWAAAARVSILAPASAAAQVLQELAPRIADYPGLREFGEELAMASLHGAIAVADRGERLAAERQALARVQDAIHEAQSLLTSAAQRTVKYAPANNVYKLWMSPDGALGALLTTVIGNDPAVAAEVQTRIVDLRRATDRLINDTFAMVTPATNKSRRIEAGARQTLIKRMDVVLSIAGAWAESSSAATELHERARTDSWSQRPLEKLRSVLPDLRGKVADDLAQLDAVCDRSSPEGLLAAAAAAAAGGMLTQTFAAIDGHPPRGIEPTPVWLVRGELLSLDLVLEPRTFQILESTGGPIAGGELEQDSALLLADRPAPRLEDMYQLRSERNEHDLTELIVAEANRSAPEVGSLLADQRERDVARTQATIDDELKAAVDRVNSRRRDETLPEHVWSRMLADLEALRQPGRRDFAAIQAAIRDIEALVDDYRSDLVEKERNRINAKAEEDSLVKQHRDKLLAIIAHGDVTGAEEYLERLTSGQDLPAGRDDARHLRAFFPAVPDLMSANPQLLDDLSSAFAGHQPPNSSAEQLFAITGFDPELDSGAGRSAAQVALGAWKSLAGSRRGGGKAVEVTTAVRPILAALGLEFQGKVELDGVRAGDRQFGTVRRVTGTRDAMTPALGSQMGGTDSDSLRLLMVWKELPPTTLVEWLASRGEENTVLVLYLAGSLNAQQRRALANAARGRSKPVAVVVDAAVLAYLVSQPEPSRRTLSLVTMPFTAASPYQDLPGNTPHEMFYGRKRELDAVVDLQNVSAFVSGGRQLGKSALLRSAKRKFDNGSTRRALLVDIRQVGANRDPEAIWPRIAAEMRVRDIGHESAEPGAATAGSVAQSISAWLGADPDRSLLILVDEADNFLQADAGGNHFTNVEACKQLMNTERRRVKFVFAGLHRTSRFSSLSNQPLAHMGEPIVVGPLRAQAAQDLITRPMAAMGFTFKEPAVQTARILAATNSVPSLLQLFGRALIDDLTQRSVDAGLPQEVTDEDISRVLDNQELADLFKNKYVLTLNLDHRYQVIVHAIALAAHEQTIDRGLRLAELAEECRLYWPAGFADLSVDYLRGLVTECCDLGLLTLDSGRYRMRTPYVLRLLGTADDVAEVLYDADQQLILPSALDAGSYRELIAGTTLHSPLTTRQIGRLFERPDSTHLIVGTVALGADRTVQCLQKYAEQGRSGAYKVQVVPGTPGSLQAAAGRITHETMLVVNLWEATASQVSAVLAAVPGAHESTRHPLIVVVVLSPGSLPSWLREEDRLVPLGRVDEAGIDLWCDESDATFGTSDERRDLSVSTGGWPILVEKVLTRSNDGRPLQPGRGLALLRETLQSQKGARYLVNACGLGDDDPVSSGLAAVFGAAAGLADAEPTEAGELAEVIAEDSEVTELVKKAGLGSVRDVLRALEVLGAVVAVGGGGDRVVTEPVLTAAYRVVRPVGTSA
jgi:hypothetical protein